MSQNLTTTGKRFDLNNPNAKTSLDAQETKSLCCAAAGITAPSSTTTEALTPQEKLREAASPDATLTAQNDLLAQPDLGYELVSGFQCFKVQAFSGDKVAHMGLNIRESIHCFLPVSRAGNVIREDQFDELQNKHSHIVNVLQKQHVRTLQTQDIQSFDYIQTTVVDKLSSPSIRSITPTTNGGSKKLLGLLNQISKLVVGSNHTLYLCDFPSSAFIPFHYRWNNHSNEYCEHGADSLNPTRSVLRKPFKLHPVSNRTSQKPESGRSEHQIPQRPKTAFNHPILIKHHSWLLATKKTKHDHFQSPRPLRREK